MVTGHGTLAGNRRAAIPVACVHGWPATRVGPDLRRLSVSDSAGREVAESEREVLLYFLTRVRDAVVQVSAGLTAEQQRTLGVPSGTSLLGLIRHPTGVEEHWFQRVFLGQNHDIDMSMTVPPAPPATRSSPPTGRRVAAATRSCGPAPICPPWPPSPIPAYPTRSR